MRKRILSLLVAAVMTIGLFPASVMAAGGNADQVRVIVENTTYEEGVWTGQLFDTWVDIDNSSTMMSAFSDAVKQNNCSEVGASSGYISQINGLGEFDGGGLSGWMCTLNDWFINAGLSEFTVASGKLEAGDEIRIMYTCDLGNDLGSSWNNNDKTLKALTTSVGTLSPAFSSGTNAYTLTLPVGTTEIRVTPTAANKNFLVKTFVGQTEYKRTAAVPVSDGSKITITCGDPTWPTMNDAADVPAQTYTLTVKIEGEEEIAYGDPSGDGKINTKDAAMAYAIINGKLQATDAQQAAIDVSGDGKVNTKDAAMIYAYVNGKLAPFPAAQ